MKGIDIVCERNPECKNWRSTQEPCLLRNCGLKVPTIPTEVRLVILLKHYFVEPAELQVGYSTNCLNHTEVIPVNYENPHRACIGHHIIPLRVDQM